MEVWYIIVKVFVSLGIKSYFTLCDVNVDQQCYVGNMLVSFINTTLFYLYVFV